MHCWITRCYGNSIATVVSTNNSQLDCCIHGNCVSCLQCELLETVLLYYKDFVHPAPELLKTAKLFQVRTVPWSWAMRWRTMRSAESGGVLVNENSIVYKFQPNLVLKLN